MLRQAIGAHDVRKLIIGGNWRIGFEDPLVSAHPDCFVVPDTVDSRQETRAVHNASARARRPVNSGRRSSRPHPDA